MDRQVVHDWLRSVLLPYVNSDRTFADVVSLLDTFPSLSPRTDLYISNVGQSLLLLQLKGTIPMQFKGQTYNVPIEVWVDKAYPREPPIAYVSPTKDMLVRKTEHVDLDGRIGGPYQQEWSRKWESKNLLGFIHACQDIFSQQPPVYAKPPASSTSRTTPSQSIAALSSSSSVPSHQISQRSNADSESVAASGSSNHHRPPPALPGQGTSGAALSSSSHSPPQKPPKPGQSPYLPTGSPFHDGAFHSTQQHFHQQHHQSQLHAGPSRGISVDSRYEGGDPVYAGIARNGGGGAHAQNSQKFQDHDGSRAILQQQTPASSGARWAGPHSPGMQQQQQASSVLHQHQYQPQNGQPRRVSNQQGQEQYYSPLTNHNSASSPASSSTSRASRGSAGPPPRPLHPPAKTQAADLLDSLAHDNAAVSSSSSSSGGGLTPTLSGPGGNHLHTSAHRPHSTHTGSAAAAPPRPLNPELAQLHQALHDKLTKRVTELRTSLEASNSHLYLLGRDLDAGLPAIEDESARLKAVLTVCRSRAESLESVVNRVKERTVELSAREPPKSVEVVLADSIVGDQLINLVAQDLATSDLLYHLGRALGSEEMELERYLKWVRLLAREQFLKRVLAAKISKGLSQEEI